MTLWHETKITDAGTPLGTGFEKGDKAWVKKEGNLWILVKPGERRWITQVQLDWFTKGLTPAEDQARPEAMFAKQEPKEAPDLTAFLPEFYRGFVIQLTDITPAVEEKLWMADWYWEAHPDTGQPLGTIYFERYWVRKLIKFPEARKEIAVTLEHEHHEALLAWEMANERDPLIVPEHTVRLAMDFGGVAHAQTVEDIDGFKGPNREVDYYDALKKKLIRWGFAEDVKNW